jgi:hypothetical protein
MKRREDLRDVGGQHRLRGDLSALVPVRDGPGPWLMAGVAALATVFALSWSAALGGRGLDFGDFRSVVIVTLAVGIVAARPWRRG